jgi:hypothetical protein
MAVRFIWSTEWARAADQLRNLAYRFPASGLAGFDFERRAGFLASCDFKSAKIRSKS